MAEAIAAIALAGNILQFIEVGYRTYHVLHQLWNDSAKEENTHIQQVAQDMSAICIKLSKPVPALAAGLSEDERKLQKLAQTCKKKAEELNTVLQKLVVDPDAKGMKRRVDVMKKTLKATWKEDKIEGLQTQMAGLSKQIAIHMIFSLSDRQSNVLKKLDRISMTAEDHSAEIAKRFREVRSDALDAFIRQEEHAQKTALSLEELGTTQLCLVDTVRNLERLSEQAAFTQRANEILRTLRFPEMHERHTAIERKHAETFRWIFDDKNSNFKTWLEQGHGAFWISGLAGSGKSTLMKYINSSPQKHEILRNWAGNRQLFVADFYFWYNGTPIQKSQEGLLRSIILKILREEPSLIPITAPDRWQQDAFLHEPWTREQLYSMLAAIIREKHEACFCFFIDGLDEYDADAGEQGEFATKIRQFAESPQIRMCVSSRRWQAFEDFGEDKDRMLKLEDLTREDMAEYVRDKLQEEAKFKRLLRRDQRTATLIHEIRDRACGVFLWVALVVKSLISGLTEHDDYDELKARLDEVPQSLEAYFKRMLRSVDGSYKRHASRLLSLAQCASPLPLSTTHWIKHELKDPDYAMKLNVETLNSNTRKEAERLLSKWAKDLLVLYDANRRSNRRSNGTLDIAGPKIRFLHRTVGDFLSNDAIKEQLRDEARDKSGNHFNLSQSLCRMLLAEAKTVDLSQDPKENQELFHNIARRTMYHAKQCEQQHHLAVTPLLQKLDKVITARIGGSSSGHWTASCKVTHPVRAGIGRREVSNSSSNFLAYAVANDLLLFVKETLNLSPHEMQKAGRPLLDFAIYPTFPKDDLFRDSTATDYSRRMVEILLECGASPNQHSEVKGNMTVWEMFLLDTWGSRQENGTVPVREGAWDVAKLLLENGANRNTTVPVKRFVANFPLIDGSRDEYAVKFQRNTTQRAGVVECLACVENSESVKEFLSGLLEIKKGFWGQMFWWTS